MQTQTVNDKMVMVYYEITTKKAHFKRRVQEQFRKTIVLTPGLCWAIGFFKGEGVNSIINGSYRRFSIVNKNPEKIKRFLQIMVLSGLLVKERIDGKCFQIHHFKKPTKDVIEYWSNALNFPKERFSAVAYGHDLHKSENGVCRFDIGHVLLRRIVELLNEHIMDHDSGEWTSIGF